jgi:hypothetical protein
MSAHKYLLRVPEDVWVEVRAAAVANRRSVNQEIVWRLSERGPGFAGAASASSDLPATRMPELDRVDPRSESRPSFRPDFKGDGR